MKNTKLLAFILTLFLLIPLIAVPELEENPFNEPTYYEKYTTPIKDYNIVTELKDMEDEGVSTAIYQLGMSELESGDSNGDQSGDDGDIKDISASRFDSSSGITIPSELSDTELKEFLKGNLLRFVEANLNPTYFIIPDVKFRNRISAVLNEITDELGLPRVHLMVKSESEELSTELLEYFWFEADFTTGADIAEPERSAVMETKFGQFVIEYLSQHQLNSIRILSIDVQEWDDGISLCVDEFLDVIEQKGIDVVIRIENISKVTGIEVLREIMSIFQRSHGDDVGNSEENALQEGTRSDETIKEVEGHAARDSENEPNLQINNNVHVREIILGATPEYADVKSVEEDKFTLVVDVINGFYYIILLTCLIPNIYFVAWAGFIRREDRLKKSRKSKKVHQAKDKGTSSEEARFNNRLMRLEQQLGQRVILQNNEKTTEGQEQLSGSGHSVTGRCRNKNNTKWPDVTIIVPCFNEQKGIALAVERCFNQRYPGRIEILIVDDGSDDYTLRLAKIFEGPFPNRTIRVFHKPNGGKASALNHGIARATGQIILTTDGDSHMDPDAVESIVRGFKANPQAGIVGGFVVIRNEKDGTLVKLQQIEYIFTQDVFRLPQSESSNVLIIPGPVFSMGGRVAKTHRASTRTCVEDADLTDTILSDNWGTVATTDAMAYTQAPASWKAWYKQRKRWIFGQFQVWRENRSLLRRNFWGLYSYFTWLSALLFTAMLFASTIALAFIGEWNFFSVLITAQTLVIFLVYFITRSISLMRYKYGTHLIKYLPMQIVYDLVNGVLCAYLFLRYLLGKGVRIKFGPSFVTIY